MRNNIKKYIKAIASHQFFKKDWVISIFLLSLVPISIIILLGGLIFYVKITHEYGIYKFNSELADLAGVPAQNCGIIWLKEERFNPLQCAQNAIQGNTPFYFAIQYQGIDSLILKGVARNNNGEITLLHYSSGSSGNPIFSSPSTYKNSCLNIILNEREIICQK